MELDPRTTALIVVHCQGDVVGPDGAFSDYFYNQVVERDVIARIGQLTDEVRRAGAHIFYTRVAWKPDLSDLEVNSPILGIVQQSGCLQEGSPLADIVEPLAPQAEDVVITHQRVGGFEASNLDHELRSRGVNTVVFAGVATNFSVEGTARVASDLGYRTVVVDDACSAASPEVHSASIQSMSLLAEITTIEEVSQALSVGAGGVA